MTNSPFRVRTFIWRCFTNRIPTKDQLVCRYILHSPHGLPCVLCFQADEELSHLFFNCRMAKLIWGKVVQWIGFEWVYEEVLWKSFLSWSDDERFKCLKKGNFRIIWTALVWNIWKIRNAILYEGAFCLIPDLIWDIKLRVWKWSFIGIILIPTVVFSTFVRRLWFVCFRFSWFGFSSSSIFYQGCLIVSRVWVPLLLSLLIYLAQFFYIN